MALSLTPPTAFDPATGQKKAGRPFKPDSAKLSKSVTVPMTQAMYEEISVLAKAGGVTRPSYLRQLHVEAQRAS